MDPDLRSIGDLLRSRAAAHPDMVATICDGRDTTFAMLDRRANQVAHGLIRSLPESPARAAILDTNSETFFELLFGAARANRVLVPINSRLSPSEMADILDDAAVELLFVGAEFLQIAEALQRGRHSVRQVVSLGDDREGWESYPLWRDRYIMAEPDVSAGRTDVVLLVYTSGTTGRPKGAQLTHENLLTNAPLLVQEYGTSPGSDMGLVCMPLFHVSGSLWAMACLYAAVPIVILRRLTADDVLGAIARHRVTKALLVPAVIQMLLDAPGRDAHDVSSLDFVLYGGSPISLALLRRALAAFKCRFGQVYGLTETAGAITYLAPEDHDVDDPARLQSCGKPLRHAHVRVVDKNGRDLAACQIGEIVCRTAQNMAGYWNRPEETAAVLRGEWLHTGDAGYFDEDGYLYIHDRIKDMIVSGGENVYPAEVEHALIGHPDVADVAVIGIPDERWGEAVNAFVVKKPGSDATPGELIAFCRQRIAGFKVPKSVEFVDALKRNAAGKVLKHELRAPYWAGQARRVS
jgi:acyl-CoA synthetase (AMP-forming)/AMP-acid ligase II